MRILPFDCSPECINDAPLPLSIPILDAIPMHPVRPWRHMIQTGIANQWTKFPLVQIDFPSSFHMLFGRPPIGVDHDFEPAHHAAAEHVAEVLSSRDHPLHDV